MPRFCHSVNEPLKAHSHYMHLMHAAEADNYVTAEIGKFLIFCTATVYRSRMRQMHVM